MQKKSRVKKVKKTIHLPQVVRIAEVILHDGNGKILLLKRSNKNKHFVGQWQLPGGKVEEGESFRKGVERELFEETGQKRIKTTKIKEFIFSYYFNGSSSRVHFCVFSCLSPKDVCLSRDHSDSRFVTLATAKKMQLTELSRRALLD